MDPTRTLKGRSLEKWNELYPLLTARRSLRPEEQDILLLYCEAFESWEDASRRVRDTTSVAMTNQHGRQTIIVNPWVTVRDAAATRMAAYAKQLGISPDSRIMTGMTFAEYMPEVEGDDDDVLAIEA